MKTFNFHELSGFAEQYGCSSSSSVSRILSSRGPPWQPLLATFTATLTAVS